MVRKRKRKPRPIAAVKELKREVAAHQEAVMLATQQLEDEKREHEHTRGKATLFRQALSAHLAGDHNFAIEVLLRAIP